MAIDSGGGAGVSGSGTKRQRVDDRCEVVAWDVDRISALPDELRLRVLTHLPLKDAIRTGALARGWRDLWRVRWAHRASLEVHLRSRGDTRRELDAMARPPRPLLPHRPHLQSQVFRAPGLSPLRRRVRRRGPPRGDAHDHGRGHSQIPLAAVVPGGPHVPLAVSLRCISVSGMYYTDARPFLVLVVIQLVSVSCAREAFRKMMALCPNLLTLDLRLCRCNGNGGVFDRLPPNLRSLTIALCDRITSLDFVRVPTLRSFRYRGSFPNLPFSIPRDAVLSDVYIHLYDSVPIKQCNIDKLRRSLPTDLSNLSVLTICDKALTCASADGASAQLPNFDLHSLKELYLLMLGMKAVNLSNLYLFLKTFQCPNLERLFVQLPDYRYAPMEGSIDQVWEEPPEDGLDNLVMVKVMDFNWNPAEVQLVSFLLRKARSLRKLSIVSRNVTPVDLPDAPEADLSLLKEALVNGKIMFTESDNAGTQPYHDALIC